MRPADSGAAPTFSRKTQQQGKKITSFLRYHPFEIEAGGLVRDI
jgi:hypothetical protein